MLLSAPSFPRDPRLSSHTQTSLSVFLGSVEWPLGSAARSQVVVQLPNQSCSTLCTPWTAAYQASLSLSISQSFPKLMSIALVMPSSHLILWHPQHQGFFQWVGSSYLMTQIQDLQPHPSNEYSGLRLTGLISLLSKELLGVFSSIPVWRHQFFGTLPPYSPALTTILDHWEDHSPDYTVHFGSVKYLLLNTLSRFVIAFLPTSYGAKLNGL